MTCPEMEGRLAEFVAGEGDGRSRVEEHLVACPDCRAAFSLARAGWDAAAEWKVGDPSPDAISSVMTALEVQPREGRGFIRVLQAATLAACLLIAFAIGTSRHEGRAVEPTPPPAAAASSLPVSTGLASVRPSVGMLFVQDEEGRPAGELAIKRLDVRVDIRDGIARTEIEEIFENRTDRRLEGTFQFPLPPDASISRLAMEIEGKLMEGEVVERQKARETYEGIVRSMKDPALLEWMPGGIFQCRIFPIEARSHKRIVIAYTQSLPVFDGRARYVYPLAGESMRELGIGRFEFAALVRSSSRLVDSKSTSHDATTIRIDDRTMRTSFAHSDFRPRSDFVVTLQLELAEEIQVSAHRPEGTEPGYFAAIITPRADAEEDLRRDRKLLFFLDASGSMARAELEAARMVVRRMVDALGPADRFRIGSHNLFVGVMPEFLAPDADGKRAVERYLADMVPAGASDVAASLETILADVPDHGELVYVGEGTPTWGEKDPAKIVAQARAAIGSKRISIRTVAVGSDADRNLLETLSREFNGGAHAVSPSDDVGARAEEIARTLGRSAITGLKAEFEGGVTDAAPGVLGAIHFGERLLVTGRYAGGAAKLVLTGRVHDRKIRREFALALPEREPGNLHVKRMWAQRRLADLAGQGEAKREETVRLSVAHQVMTPYTSFLVLENEKAYEDHRIERTKKDADQSKDPKVAGVTPEHVRKREVLERVAHILEEAYAAFDERRFDECTRFCDEILAIDPQYTVAAELKEDARKVGLRETPPSAASSEKLEVSDLTLEWLETDRQPIFDGEALANLIKATIHKSSWNEAEGRTCVFENGLMIVRNSPKVKRQVRKFLNDLRASSESLLVAVENRFLTVEENFKEAVGEADPSLEIMNVQDFTYGLQDFPGVNITLSEDALGRRGPRTLNVPHLGDLPQFDYLYGSRLDNRLPRQLRSAPSDLRTDGYYSERHDSLYYWLGEQKLPPQVFGVNVSVSIPGVTPTLSLLVDDPSPRLQEPAPELDKLTSGVSALTRELEEKLLRISDLNKVVEEGRAVSSKALQERMNAVQDLQYQRQEAERLAKQLGSLESTYMKRQLSRVEAAAYEQARQREALETLIQLHSVRNPPAVASPRKALSAQVTAVAKEQDLVVISIGREAGVNEGDEFTIYRGKSFVGKITVDRVDRAWASGRVTQKGKEDPRLGDQASNNVLYAPGKDGMDSTWPEPPQTAELKVLGVSGMLLTLSGAIKHQLQPGSKVMMWRFGSYISAASVTEVNGNVATARVIPELNAAPVEKGDPALVFNSLSTIWAVLPLQIRQDLVSRSAQAALRFKLLLLRAMKESKR